MVDMPKVIGIKEAMNPASPTVHFEVVSDGNAKKVSISSQMLFTAVREASLLSFWGRKVHLLSSPFRHQRDRVFLYAQDAESLRARADQLRSQAYDIQASAGAFEELFLRVEQLMDQVSQQQIERQRENEMANLLAQFRSANRQLLEDMEILEQKMQAQEHVDVTATMHRIDAGLALAKQVEGSMEQKEYLNGLRQELQQMERNILLYLILELWHSFTHHIKSRP